LLVFIVCIGQEVIGLFLTPQQVFSSSTDENNELLDHADHSNAVTVLTATVTQSEQVCIPWFVSAVLSISLSENGYEDIHPTKYNTLQNVSH
jgi:hypothetical protein